MSDEELDKKLIRDWDFLTEHEKKILISIGVDGRKKKE